jgi:hypothetical protein
MTRERLPNRRRSTSFNFEHRGLGPAHNDRFSILISLPLKKIEKWMKP